MTTKFECPIGDPTQCKHSPSLELSGGRGILQVNCQTCGHAQSVALPQAEALELFEEMHRHRVPAGVPDPPPAAEEPEASGQEPREDSPGNGPQQPLGKIDAERPTVRSQAELGNESN